MRVIVIGLGAVGAMAAWRLAAAGHEVTALEQFRVDHDRGSSFGESRIVRRVYPDLLYTRMMARAYELWDALMAESGDASLFVRCGGLYFGPRTHADVIAADAALAASGVPHECLEAGECARRFPAIRFDPEEIGLFEPSMGYARASRAVSASVGMARRRGAVVREECRVTAIEPARGGVRVTLASGERLEAERLVVAPGPWAAALLEPLGVRLPVTVTRQPYVHLAPERDEDLFLPDRFPVWIDAGTNSYGFPRLGEVDGVKVGINNRGETTSPESADRTVRNADRDAVREYARRRFPSLSPRITYEKVCLYTVTPDNDFVIDQPPGMPQITILSACSGHGFKFAPLMGQIAADIVAGRSDEAGLQRFRLARFERNDPQEITFAG